MVTGVRTARLYHFGGFTLDARTGELSNDGRRTRIRDQSLHLLLALLERPGELIAREALTRRLWPAGTFADFDRSLNKVVNHLREALGDSAEQPRFIETLPRKGYRFIAPVTTSGADVEIAPAPSLSRAHRWQLPAMLAAGIVIATVAGSLVAWKWAAGRRAAPRITALAVIPLENLSRDPDQQYFADGLTDALITDLAKIGGVRLTSRTSVMQYRGTKKSVKEIGRELNVDAIVEGTVTHAGSRVRITAQLIQVSTDMHLWEIGSAACRQSG